MDFKIGNCRVCISPLFMVMLCIILFADRTGIMLFGLIAVAIHETGHLVIMLINKKYPETVVFQVGGINIKSRGFSGYNCDFFVALGGCLFNFIAFVVSITFYFKFTNQLLLLFSAANFGLMVFNLMPINGLDGMDLIEFSLLRKYSPDKTKHICFIISSCFLIVLLLVCLFAVFMRGINPTILICILYLVILTLISLKV